MLRADQFLLSRSEFFWRRTTHPEEGNLSIAVLIILAVMGVVWWRYQHQIAAAHDREEQLEFEVHGADRAHEFAKVHPNLTKLNGWAGTGGLWATLVVHGFASYETDRLT
jgi:hypothetical protein